MSPGSEELLIDSPWDTWDDDAVELVGLLGAEVAYWPCAPPGAESSRR